MDRSDDDLALLSGADFSDNERRKLRRLLRYDQETIDAIGVIASLRTLSKMAAWGVALGATITAALEYFANWSGKP